MVPITALTVIVRQPVVEILFGSGKISQPNLDLIASTLAYLRIGLTAHALIAVLARGFYARQDTVTPVLAAVARSPSTAAWRSSSSGRMACRASRGHRVAAWIEALALLAILHHRLPHFELRGLARRRDEAVVGSAPGRGRGVPGPSMAPGNAIGVDPGRLLACRRGQCSSPCLALVYAALSLRVADPRTAVYRRGHGRRAPAPRQVVTAVDPTSWDAFVEAVTPARTFNWAAWRRSRQSTTGRPTGSAMDPTATGAPGGRIGAQILVRQPATMPWGFAYAPRGPVASDWTPEAIAPSPRRPRATAARPGGSATCGSTRRSRPTGRSTRWCAPPRAREAGWRPAPRSSPTRPGSSTCARRGALYGDLRKKWRQYVNKAGPRASRWSTRTATGSASSTGSTARPPTGPAS
jgi:hypothetical protein